jgi:hypothetical protein
MGGVKIVLAAGLAAAVLAYAPSALAAPPAARDLRAVAAEKAAAVALMRQRASRQTALIANDRLFEAYFRAATTSEAERIERRIGHTLGDLGDRYGLNGYSVAWPDGRSFASPHPDKRGHDARGKAGKNPSLAVPRHDTKRVTWTAAVMHNATPSLVVSVDQDLAAYERVLLHGLAENLWVVIVDAEGRIVADSTGREPRGQPAMFAGLTIAELRATIGAGAPEGMGILTQDGSSRRVSYQTVDGWIVVAVEQPVSQRTCINRAGPPCP